MYQDLFERGQAQQAGEVCEGNVGEKRKGIVKEVTIDFRIRCVISSF